MASSLPRPPYDPELSTRLDAMPSNLSGTLTHEEVKRLRAGPMYNTNLSGVLSTRQVTHEARQIQSPKGSKSVTISIFCPKNTNPGPKPCLYWLHGGGLIFGNKLSGVSFPLDVAERFDVICVTVDYGLAPENPYPAAVEDCYAGVKWINAHAEELGVDARRIMIGGTSAGGGIAVGTALMCRDNKGPALFAMCLKCPMLDDRELTLSRRQYAENKTWSQQHNAFGWDSYLGKQSRGPDVSIYAAPGRAEDLSGLPETYLDAGSAELFRDEVVAFASKLWASGVQSELHIWPGVYHGSETTAPAAAVSKLARETRMTWIERIFARKTEST
jgi:acetyl esterase/lipase